MSTKQQIIDCVLNGDDILKIAPLVNLYKRKQKRKIDAKLLKKNGFVREHLMWVICEDVDDIEWTRYLSATSYEEGHSIEWRYLNRVETAADLEDVFDILGFDKEIVV